MRFFYVSLCELRFAGSRRYVRTEIHLTKHRRLPYILSLIGGILILLSAVGRVLVDRLAFSSSIPIYDRGPIFQIYEALQNNGFNSPSMFVTVPISILAGVLIIIGASELLRKNPWLGGWGAVVLLSAVASLAGTGGAGIGAILAIIGGSMVLFRRE